MPTAYSYQRFSTAEQAHGDSERRQTAACDKWLAAHPDVKLDTTLRMLDAGRSAFKRDDWADYALAGFIREIESGRVKRGSFLLVENLDRLSRETPTTAVQRFLTIIGAGITIVSLSPDVTVYDANMGLPKLMMAMMEFGRGNSESAIKSERGRAAWAAKHAMAAPGRPITGRVPLWIEFKPGPTKRDVGTLAIRPGAQTIIKRIYTLAMAGYGVEQIAGQLNAKNVPMIGRQSPNGGPRTFPVGDKSKPPAERPRQTIRWTGSIIHHILTSPAAIGTYTPGRRRGNTPNTSDKPPVPNYYPAVVERETFYAVAAALDKRRRVGRGRRGKSVNLLSGLLRDWRDGGTMCYWARGKNPTAIIPTNAKTRRTISWASFPATVLESALFSQLSEVTTDSLGSDNTATLTVDALTGRIAGVDNDIAVWRGQMNTPNINPDTAATITARLDKLHAERRGLETELLAARHAAANPVRESWDAARGLLSIANTPDERTRLRAALRRAITEIRCLFRVAGRHRLGIVRVTFANNGGVRTYVINYRVGAGRKPGRWWARSDVAMSGDMAGPIVESTDDAFVRPLVERLLDYARDGSPGEITTGGMNGEPPTPADIAADAAERERIALRNAVRAALSPARSTPADERGPTLFDSWAMKRNRKRR